MAIVTYRGTVPEIQGEKFDVPASVPLTSRAKWIESTWREEQARSAAEAEREAREQRLLQERIESTRQQNAIDNLTAELQGMADRLEELSGRIVEEPDTAAMVRWNAASASIYERSLRLADEVAVAQSNVTELLERIAAAAEEAAQGAQMKTESLLLLKNQQRMTAAAFESYREELERLSLRTNNAIVEVGELNTSAQENRDVIEQAADISQQAVDIAQQAARAEIQKTREELLDLMALCLRALGLRESDLIATANSIEVAPNDSGTIRRATVERFIEISGKANAAIERARGESVE